MFTIILLPDSTTALLNSKPHALSHHQFKLMLFVTTSAKQVIAKAWKTDSLSILLVKQSINLWFMQKQKLPTLITYVNLKPCGNHGLNISYHQALIPHYYFLKVIQPTYLIYSQLPGQLTSTLETFPIPHHPSPFLVINLTPPSLYTSLSYYSGSLTG